MASDDFGFVADDNTDDFGFVSDEDRETEVNPSSEVGMGESALRGAEQGLTFGFADELGGAVGAGLEGVSEAVKQRSLAPVADSNLERLYNEYRNFNRKRYKEAEQANPWSFTGGGIAGGALVPGTAFGKLGQLGKTPTLGTKVSSGIGVGMVSGGLQSAGNTEAPIMSKKFADDVFSGAEIGGLVGGGLPITGASAKGVYNIGKAIASPIIKGFKQGIRGINLLGDEAERAIQADIAKYGKDLSGDIQNRLNQLGATKNALIKEAQENGIQVSPQKIDEFMNARLGDDVNTNLPEVQREMEQFREMLRTAKQGPIVEKDTRVFYGDGKTPIGKFEDLFIQKQAEKVLAPRRIDQLTGEVIEEAPLEVIYEATDVPNKTIGVIRQAIYNEVGEPVGYKKIASKLMNTEEAAKFKDITENVRAGGRNLNDPSELYQLYKDLKQKSSYGDYSFKSQEAQKATSGALKDVQGMLRGAVEGLESTDAKIASLKQGAKVLGMEDTVNVDKQQMMNKIIDLINQQETVGGTGSKAREKLAEFANSIRAQHPELAQQVETRIKDLGEQAMASKGVAGLTQAGVVSTVKRSAMASGNVAGQAVYKLAKLPPESITQVAQSIASKGGKTAQELGRIIGELPNKNERERNAILFGLMQNPAYRQYLNLTEESEKVQ